jgi:hypothetical protein
MVPTRTLRINGEDFRYASPNLTRALATVEGDPNLNVAFWYGFTAASPIIGNTKTVVQINARAS